MDARDIELRLALSCELPATREQVFRALTEPAELVKWWGPHGITLVRAVVDPSVAGGYRFAMQPANGALFHISGDFLAVDPPRGLSYTFRYEEPTPDDRETVVAIALEERGEQTVLNMTQGVFATEERLALHERGWSDSFERLTAALRSS